MDSGFISRKAAIELYDGDFTNSQEYHVPVPVIIQNLKDIPEADVRPIVHANWIGKNICSNCGARVTQSQKHYCCNCGAKMR